MEARYRFLAKPAEFRLRQELAAKAHRRLAFVRRGIESGKPAAIEALEANAQLNSRRRAAKKARAAFMQSARRLAMLMNFKKLPRDLYIVPDPTGLKNPVPSLRKAVRPARTHRPERVELEKSRPHSTKSRFFKPIWIYKSASRATIFPRRKINKK